jgi:TetR/AcrR family transcriptional regulator
MVLSALGGNVFYFLSAPIWRQVLGFDPFEEEVLRARRVSLVQFLGKAIFMDRQRGAELAAKVLADTPMPDCANFKGQFHSSEVKDK